MNTPKLTDEQIEAAITKGVQAGEISWLGFKIGSDGKFSVPVLSKRDYQAARAIEAAATAPLLARIAELERLHKEACNMYDRKNRSGCVCKIDPDTDELLSPCGLHAEWLEEKTAALQSELAAAKAAAQDFAWLIEGKRGSRIMNHVLDNHNENHNSVRAAIDAMRKGEQP